MIALALMAVAAVADCNRLPTTIARDECELSQSLELDEGDRPFDCKGLKTQADMNVCSYRDYLRSDIELNQVWDAVTKRLARDSSAGRTVLESQRAWLTYRDKQCNVWAKWYEGGTVAALMINNCLTDITKFRTKELAQFLEGN